MKGNVKKHETFVNDHSAAKTIPRKKMNEFSDVSCNHLEMSDSF